MLRSLEVNVTELIDVVVPLTVRLPPIEKLPPTAERLSTYVLVAFCVATLASLFCDSVASVENSLIAAPN